MKTFIRSLLIIPEIIIFISFNVKAQEFVWAHNVNGGDIFNSGIAIDKKGNSYITGTLRGDSFFGTIQVFNHGDQDIYLAKYDSTGNCLWAKSPGGISADGGDGITVDVNGFIYITGYFFSEAVFDTIHISPHSTGFNMFLAKYDPLGNCLWVSQAVSGNNIRGLAVTTDAERNSYVTGRFMDTTILGSTQLISYGGPDIFIAKYNPDGICLWAKHAGGNAISYEESGQAICHDANDNIYITGIFWGTAKFDTVQLVSAGDWDIFVAKYDSNGNLIWANRAGGSYHDMGTGLSVDSSENCYVTGAFFGPTDFGTNHLTGFSGYDIFLAKYDPNGNCLWAKQAGGSGYDYGYAVSTDPSGNSYVTGNYQDTSTFCTIQLIASSYQSPFIAKYDTYGKCKWVKQVIGGGIGFGISVDANDNIYTSGEFGGTAMFDTIQLSGGIVFIAKLANYTTDIKTETNLTSPVYLLVQNYPNPFNPTTTINYSIPKEGNIKLMVFNVIGSKVVTIVDEHKAAGNYSVIFNAADLPSGVYFYKLVAEQFSLVKKMMLIK